MPALPSESSPTPPTAFSIAGSAPAADYTHDAGDFDDTSPFSFSASCS